MRFLCIFICLLALSGCKRDAEAPAEEAAAPAPAVEAEPATEEPAADPAPAPAAEAAPEPEPTPRTEPDPNAPKNVAAAPKDARRTDSGVAWKRLAKGKGKQRAGRIDTVAIVYTGWLPDGRMFDNSGGIDAPVVVRADLLIPGMSEMVRAMAPGEKRRVWVPARLGYGELDSGYETSPTQPLGELVFDIELLSITKAPPTPAAPKDVGAIPSDATVSESGLAWRVVEQGTGTDRPIITSIVEMSYTMWSADGQVVDSTVLRQGVDTVGISRLIPGWTEGMKLMAPGERRIFWVPEDLAYQGARHRPKGMMVIDVTLVGIRADIHQVR